MLFLVPSVFSTVMLESEMTAHGDNRYNLATFMAFFLLITIEVVIVKVVTFEMERDDDSHPEDSAVSRFFDWEDWLFSSSSCVEHFYFFFHINDVRY